MIFLESAWDEVKRSAEEHFLNNETWASPIKNRMYSVNDIKAGSITINRDDGGEPAVLSRTSVVRMVQMLNDAGGRVPRGRLYHIVAIETALVQFHPLLSREGDEIFEIPFEQAISSDPPEPINNSLRKQFAARTVRAGQAALRNRMLFVYNGKCCISETGPTNVLEAAHIEAYNINGLNHPSNAILLRADLHNLFDDDLLGIHPDTLQVHVSPRLNNTIYMDFHMKTLQQRGDDSQLDNSKLRAKWKLFNEREEQ